MKTVDSSIRKLKITNCDGVLQNVKIPVGWSKVISGNSKPGDEAFNYKENCFTVCMTKNTYYRDFYCLIRKDQFVNGTYLTRDEKSLLLYFETCAVDNLGNVDSRRMNETDFEIAEKWNKSEFIELNLDQEVCANWVVLSEEAWEVVSKLRREKAERMFEKRDWYKSNKVNAPMSAKEIREAVTAFHESTNQGTPAVNSER